MNSGLNLTQNFSDDPTLIYVIDLNTVTDEHTPEDLQDAGNTYRALKERNAGPRRISEEECLQVTARRGAIYIFPIFHGKAFEYLKKLKCRVFGTPIVMQCLRTNGRLPKEDFPVFSKTLDGDICCTGLRTSERAAIMEKIRWMGGRFHGDLTDKVTHLIAEECDSGSKKYVIAVKRNLPVLSKDWIDDAWNQVSVKRCFYQMTLDDAIAKFKIPVFAKLVITVSQMSQEDRTKLGDLVEHHGGVFTREMRKGKCTHLVTDVNSGQKVKMAKVWGSVKIVSTHWIHHCIEKGVRLNEKDYAPGTKPAGPLCSTPSDTAGPIPDPNISAIPGCSDLRSNNITNGSVMSNNTTMASKIAETPHGTLRSQRIHSTRESLVQMHRRLSTVDPISRVDLPSLGDLNNCLQGCGIVLSGFAEVNQPKWRRVLTITGAVRCLIQDISSSKVTHIVLGPDSVSEELLLAIKNRSHEVPVVTPDWLLQCAQLRMQVPRLEFIHPMFESNTTRNSLDTTSSKSRILPSRGRSVLDPMLEQSSASASLVKPEPQPSSSHHSVQNKENQVIRIDEHRSPAPKRTTLEENAPEPHEEEIAEDAEMHQVANAPELEVAQDVIEDNVQPAQERPQPVEQPVVAHPEHEEEMPTDRTVGDASFRIPRLLQKKTFRVEGFSEEDHVEEQIAEWGGTVLAEDDARLADYCILPLLLFHADFIDASDTMSKEVVSWFWIWQCQADQAILDVDANPLFRPMGALDVPEDLFSGCIVALRSAGFHPVVYEELNILLQQYGATIQKEIRAKDSEEGRRNTHVIVGEECDRSAFARKKGIPVVDASWILESIIKKQRLPAEDFPLRGTAFRGYTRTDEAFIKAKPRDITQMEQLVELLHVQDNQPEVVPEEDQGSRMEWNEEQLKIPSGQPLEESPDEIDEDLSELRISDVDNNMEEEDPVEVLEQHAEGTSAQQEDPSVTRVIAQKPNVSEQSPSPSYVQNQLEKTGAGNRSSAVMTPSRIPRLQGNRFEAPVVTQGATLNGNSAPSNSQRQNAGFTQRAPSTCEIRSRAIDAAIERIQKNASAKPRLSSRQNRSAPASGHESAGKLGKRPSQELSSERKEALKLEPSQESNTDDAPFRAPPIKWEDDRSAVCSYPERLGFSQIHRETNDQDHSIKIVGSLNAQRIIDLTTPEEEDVIYVDQPNEAENPADITAEPVFEEVVPIIRRVFYITAIKDESLKRHCIQIIDELGGEMDGDDGSGVVTHLITPSLTRSEKVLSGIARGLWVLTPQYLFDSKDEGRFLEETAYEHGQIPEKSYKAGAEEKLAAACKRWRMRVAEKPEYANGAFSKWNVAVYGGSKAESVVRLIRLGGGTATLKSELGNSFRGITHVLVDSSNSDFYKGDLVRLVRWKIPCYKLEFTAQALMDYPLIERDYYASEYKEMLERGTVL